MSGSLSRPLAFGVESPVYVHLSHAIGPVLLLATICTAAPLSAEVTRIDIDKQVDLANGYEKVVGRLHFAIDPRSPRNAVEQKILKDLQTKTDVKVTQVLFTDVVVQ